MVLGDRNERVMAPGVNVRAAVNKINERAVHAKSASLDYSSLPNCREGMLQRPRVGATGNMVRKVHGFISMLSTSSKQLAIEASDQPEKEDFRKERRKNMLWSRENPDEQELTVEEEVKRLKGENQNLRQLVEELKDRCACRVSDLEQGEKQLTELQTTLRETEARLSEASRREHTMEEKVRTLESSVSQQLRTIESLSRDLRHSKETHATDLRRLASADGSMDKKMEELYQERIELLNKVSSLQTSLEQLKSSAGSPEELIRENQDLLQELRELKFRSLEKERFLQRPSEELPDSSVSGMTGNKVPSESSEKTIKEGSQVKVDRDNQTGNVAEVKSLKEDKLRLMERIEQLEQEISAKNQMMEANRSSGSSGSLEDCSETSRISPPPEDPHKIVEQMQKELKGVRYAMRALRADREALKKKYLLKSKELSDMRSEFCRLQDEFASAMNKIAFMTERIRELEELHQQSTHENSQIKGELELLRRRTSVAESLSRVDTCLNAVDNPAGGDCDIHRMEKQLSTVERENEKLRNENTILKAHVQSEESSHATNEEKLATDLVEMRKKSLALETQLAEAQRTIDGDRALLMKQLEWEKIRVEELQRMVEYNSESMGDFSTKLEEKDKEIQLLRTKLEEASHSNRREDIQARVRKAREVSSKKGSFLMNALGGLLGGDDSNKSNTQEQESGNPDCLS
eukprot:CAMPEP_0184684648 /NCGR_PEP_ID=MMETSP0312-20130426/16133_1 /TAXON_ID=31354 /ORGANISM="Compsopogon coeruleus, Strain SAG 36.94" /LENGTH=691 /DNA_ID=CAMNT_0027138035 /DNA_START=188 /DNA_END=2263 /DNA_ORIENTATION=-